MHRQKPESSSDDRPGQFDTIGETPDASRGEVNRIRQVYRPTGLTAELSVEYANGSLEVTYYNFTTTGFKVSHRRYVKPDVPGPRYVESETLFDPKTGVWYTKSTYRPDGTLQFQDEPGPDKFSVTRKIFDVDGNTLLRTVVLEQ